MRKYFKFRFYVKLFLKTSAWTTYTKWDFYVEFIVLLVFLIWQDDDDPDPSQFLECAEIIEGEVNIKTESVEEEEEIDDDPGLIFTWIQNFFM